jgi:hypothetical protein
MPHILNAVLVLNKDNVIASTEKETIENTTWETRPFANAAARYVLELV